MFVFLKKKWMENLQMNDKISNPEKFYAWPKSKIQVRNTPKKSFIFSGLAL